MSGNSQPVRPTAHCTLVTEKKAEASDPRNRLPHLNLAHLI
jgi:hypothetical protein